MTLMCPLTLDPFLFAVFLPGGRWLRDSRGHRVPQWNCDAPCAQSSCICYQILFLLLCSRGRTSCRTWGTYDPHGVRRYGQTLGSLIPLNEAGEGPCDLTPGQPPKSSIHLISMVSFCMQSHRGNWAKSIPVPHFEFHPAFLHSLQELWRQVSSSVTYFQHSFNPLKFYLLMLSTAQNVQFVAWVCNFLYISLHFYIIILHISEP